MKNDQNGRRPKQKTTKLKVKKDYVRVFSKDKGDSYLRFARFFTVESFIFVFQIRFPNYDLT